jgi:naphtho-gamma-pyrone polyketide synthase
VLGSLRNEDLRDYRQRIPVLSIATGATAQSHDFQELLRQAVTECLCEQVRWDRLCHALKSRLAQYPSLRSCVVVPVTSNAASLLCSALQQESELSVTISNTLNTKVERGNTGPAPGKFQDSKIAIVGFSGRFPEAASNDEFWKVLKAARDCHRTIPEDRYDWEAHYDADGKKKNHSRVKFGCFINDPGVFDARFFNLSPREAENTDPAQRLALMSAYEAMEMAGLVPDRTASTQRDRIGVFFGVTSDDWREVNSGQDIDTYFIPGGNRAFVPGRISYFFRFSGPSISVDTACSSSFAAISTACSYLWQGDCDSAIAGGTNVLTNPDNFVGLDRGHFLSATGNCNPFDDSASGYCRADAVGAVVLKRIEDAVADGDPIFGVIAGCSTNHCGQTVSITRPHEGDQLSLFRRILRHTNTDPTDVSYVEMHGTGTQAGDAAEMRSVLSAFAWDHRRSSMQPKRPLHLGAVKANVGHSESASGVTALIKVLMMMQHSEIPPHRLNGALNRNYPVDMGERNVHIPFKATPWRREDCPSRKRMAFLNNFSAAGGNTALLLEDAPLEHDVTYDLDPRDVLPVTVTARTSQSLTDNIRALVDHLASNPDVSLPALSYTSTARRAHHKYRVLVSGTNVEAIKSALQRRHEASAAVKPVKPVPPNVAFTFTGQGTLYTGIAKQLYHHVAIFRSDLVRFDRIARWHGFPSFLSLINGQEELVDAHTVDPVVAHLAVTCVQMALAHLWRLWAGEPSCVTGHSLGEYAALYTAGVLSASDTIYLVGSRAQLLVKHCSKSTHSMLAVKAPATVVAAELTSSGCAIACINSPMSTTISGPREAIQHLSKLLRDKNIDVVPLDVPYAFHSTQVDPILDEYEDLANCVHFQKPAVPYMSPLLSEIVTALGIINASYLVRATRQCVNFQGAINAARETKIVNDSTIWLELGTHPACSGMVKQTIGPHVVTAPTLRKDGHTWKVIAGVLDVLYHAGIDVQWSQFHHGFPAAQRVVALPSYKWSLQRYWIQYRHNFCLTKGDDPLTFVSKNPPLLPPTNPVKSLSSSVHRIIEENTSTEVATMLVESDLHDTRMAPIVSGHKVNTAMLCPSSLYADMAFTVAKRMLKANDMLHEKTGLDCGTMNIKRPLIMHPDAISQLLRVSAEAKWLKSEIYLTFFSVDANARTLSEHATCTVKVVENQGWLNEWKRNAYLISSRISSICEAVDRGSAHKLKRGLAYKLFSSLVDYSREYQGMEQVILDSESLEATAQVKFQVDQQGFDWHPCWIDSLGHIAGFIMNGNENIYAKDQVFINHGWDAMRCCKMVEYGKTYTTYNRMQLEAGTMYVGDTYVFDGQEIIAVFEGVRVNYC